MAQFRKKPVVIEATQYLGQHVPGVCEGECAGRDGCVPHVHTLEVPQGHTVTHGDWIITGVKGEQYACKPDIFAMTYESADMYPNQREQAMGIGPAYQGNT